MAKLELDDKTPGELVELLERNHELQAIMSLRLEDLKEESCEIRERLAPAIPARETLRFLVGYYSDRLRVVTLHRCESGDLLTSILPLVRPESLHWPAPDQGPSPDGGVINPSFTEDEGPLLDMAS